MVFKIDLDKIADSLTREFTRDVPTSTSKILANVIEEAQEKVRDQKECENLTDLGNSIDLKRKKTTIKTKPKIKKTSKKKLIKNGVSLPKDDLIIGRLIDKEKQITTVIKPKPIKVEKKKRSTEIVAVGRRLLAIDDALFNADFSHFLKKNPISSNDTFIADPLRGRSGLYWSLNKESKSFEFVGNKTEYKNRSPFTFDFHEVSDDNEVTDFGRTVQVISLESKKSNFQNAQQKYSKDLWKSFIGGKKYLGSTKTDEKLDFIFDSTIREDEIFFDHSFDLNLPFDQEQLNKLTIGGALTADVRPNYNFFIEDYETNIAKKDVLENTLPNMYVMLSEMNSDLPNPEFAKLISLNGNVQTDSKKLLTFKKKQKQLNKSRVYDLKSNPMGEYFDLFGRQYANAVKDGSIAKLNNKFSNIAVSIEDIDLIRKFTDKQELFPLNISLRFSTDKTTTFAQTLKDTHLLDAFTSKIINKFNSKQFELITTEQAIEETIQGDQGVTKKTNFSKASHRTWDLADIIDDLEEGQEPLTNKAIYLGEYQTTVKNENRPEFKFFRSLNSKIFQSKLQTLIRDKLRSYEDILNGQLAYSETVLYRIAKFAGVEATGEPLQNIWIPNATNLDVLEYVDTQVKYDKRYTYVVYAYQMVMGNKYWYSDLKTDQFDHHASFLVYQEPSFRLIEVPYYSFTTRIVDKPPAPPEVNFIGYKGVDNQFMIMFNNSVTEFKAQPIIVKQSDQNDIAKIRETQRLKSKDPITYGGDDRIAQYEIYRLAEKPTSYIEFSDALRKVVDTDVSKTSQQKATSAAIIDTIEPNKKYWYIFRAIDIHGHISNPTFLYEAEIINEHGTIFPLVNVVDFKELFEKEPSKTMKRFIQIIPTVLQGLIDEDRSGFLNAKTAEQIKNKVTLSLADQKVWGKSFRIRLISRNTGKKIDFDINFQHRTIKRLKSE